VVGTVSRVRAVSEGVVIVAAIREVLTVARVVYLR
jgi:hypothetical protein